MNGVRIIAVCGALALTGVSASTAPREAASYTVQQAYTGRLDYYESCAECHGAKLEGVFGPALAGGNDNLQYQKVADVYAYMSAHMPHGNPESLPQAQYVAIMAFLMQAHGFAPGQRELTKTTVAGDTTLMGEAR
jgi:mono/diheme cytochrome c family protein